MYSLKIAVKSFKNFKRDFLKVLKKKNNIAAFCSQIHILQLLQRKISVCRRLEEVSSWTHLTDTIMHSK